MKDEEFTFSSLIKPGEGTRHALEQELRRMKARDDARWRWEPGYVYTGTAGLLLQHGQWFTGRHIPEQYAYLRGPMSRCYMNALEACEKDPTLRYFCGMYLAGTVANGHAWCIAPDGGVVDVTHGYDDEPGVALVHERGGSVPYLPSAHVAYVGVEFDTAWARRWIDAHKLVSILDPRGDLRSAFDPATDTDDDEIFRHLYSKGGVPLP